MPPDPESDVPEAEAEACEATHATFFRPKRTRPEQGTASYIQIGWVFFSYPHVCINGVCVCVCVIVGKRLVFKYDFGHILWICFELPTWLWLEKIKIKKLLGKSNQRLKPAVCPSSSILSHSYIYMDLSFFIPCLGLV